MSLIKRAPKPAGDAPEDAKKAAQAAATAPDSGGRKLVGKRVLINVGFEPEFLAKVDELCAAHGGLKRPAMIRLALSKMIESKA